MKRDTSAQRAAKRRFRLLVLLHEHPYRYVELVEQLDQEELFGYDRFAPPNLIKKHIRYQFRHDLNALHHLNCEVVYDPQTKCYVWKNSPFGLSLPSTHLSSFALLLQTFADTNILHGLEIQDLLHYLSEHLPADQQKRIEKQKQAFEIDLRETTDYRQANQVNVKQIELAIGRGQQLEFLYRSPRQGKELRHVIEPQPLIYKNGHVYLSGWCIDCEKDLQFRLDYLLPASAKMLPTTSVRQRPSPTTYQLRYHLDSRIARNSVSERFPAQIVERHPDGSAIVAAQITDLFEARRILISYGKYCQVLAPPELVEEFRDISAELYKIYHTSTR